MRRRPPSSTLSPNPTLFRSIRTPPPATRPPGGHHASRAGLCPRTRPLSTNPSPSHAPAPSRQSCCRPILGFLHPAQHRSEEHTSELQSRLHLVCRLLLDKQT